MDDTPAFVTTVTRTVPEPAGTTTVIREPESLTWKYELGEVPKQTARVPMKSVPVMVTREPNGPLVGTFLMTEAVPVRSDFPGAADGTGGPMSAADGRATG